MKRLILVLAIRMAFSIRMGFVPTPSLFGVGFGFLGQTEAPDYVGNCFDEVAQKQNKRTDELELAYSAQNYGFPLAWRQKEQVEGCSTSNIGISIGTLMVNSLVLTIPLYFIHKLYFSKK